ncbi:MAG: acetyl-CoA carboxylase carboxyl transferase subunit alpha/beta [Desulfovibrio sp.]
MDIDKKLDELVERTNYIQDILGDRVNTRLDAFKTKLDAAKSGEKEIGESGLRDLQQTLTALEEDIDKDLTPMDKVRIVRHPQRICLKDILENVYDNYTEVGGQGEHSIDPSIVIARAYITRRVGKKVLNQPVMVVGQEKEHGSEFRNGGSVKPWGNAKALKYMKVAAAEGIPIHAYISTPGSYPIEDYPGAAQQIAENIYEMAGLDVPIVAITSEGGSGGAEAIGLADIRMMFSHGYYSVISPEGAAAIEGRIRPGQRAPVELIEKCAKHQQITAQDNKRNGYVDGVIQEPPLGARPTHFDFFKSLRSEVIHATDKICLSVGGMRLFRKLAMRRRARKVDSIDNIIVRWKLSAHARERLVAKRHKKYRAMAQTAYIDNRSFIEKLDALQMNVISSAHSAIRYGVVRNLQKKVSRFTEETTDEFHVITGKLGQVKEKFLSTVGVGQKTDSQIELELVSLSEPVEDSKEEHSKGYRSPQALTDREISCPNAKKRGCLDIWARDLFGEFGGVCPTCGHHFRMEYQWYLANVFDKDSILEFNRSITAGNPTEFPNFDERVQGAKNKTGLNSGCMTYTASIEGINLTCATLIADFRGGSVGAAEGEKFIRALELAQKKHHPFLAYVHGTAGIRIQEGVNGLIQMPRCTLAVRRYIEAGGLYIVLYDTNSYAGPVASFLGCSPYQYAVRSARLGFAGPGVIKETTGLDLPPDYHSVQKALTRGHIQDIWDRREIRRNLKQSFMTMGGRNLYYR